MPIDMYPYNYNYHFVLNDPVTLREKFKVDPWDFPVNRQFVSHANLPPQLFDAVNVENPLTQLQPDEERPYKHVQLQRLGKDSMNQTSQSILAYDRFTPWLTQKSLLMQYEHSSAKGEVTSHATHPNGAYLFAKLKSKMLCMTPLSMIAEDNKPLSIQSSPTLKQDFYLGFNKSVRNPQTLEKFSATITMVEQKIDPDEPAIITFKNPEPDPFDLDFSGMGRLDPQKLGAAIDAHKNKNFDAMMNFIDCLYNAKIILPNRELPSQQAERLTKKYTTPF